jgi:hypothetical protein
MMRAEHLDVVDARVLVAIALYRREYGHGPAWYLIAKAAGWNEGRELPERLGRLRNSGLVWYSTKPRSIRLHPGVLEIALERLRHDEERATA